MWSRLAGTVASLTMAFGTSGCALFERTLEPGAILNDCKGCPELVVVPPGSFDMGAPGGEEGRPEGPVRRIDIRAPFAVGRFEITNAQFENFVDATGYAPAAACGVWGAGSWQYPEDANWRDPGYQRPPMPDEPVACVSWLDAQAYARWLADRTGLAYRLLTEAEWEYAAKAGTRTAFFWGDDPDQGCLYANMFDLSGAAKWGFDWEPVDCDDGFAEASPVGALQPNAYGLHDILGNVWEWTEDCYIAPYLDSLVDGSAVQSDGACDRRSVRGGSWITRASRHRTTFRGRDPEDTVFSFFGFRVARDLTAEERQRFSGSKSQQ